MGAFKPAMATTEESIANEESMATAEKSMADAEAEEGSEAVPQSKSEVLKSIDGGRKYASKEYWDKRYELSGEETVYDWHHTFAGLKVPIDAVVKHDDRILMLGCGNAAFPADMHDDGF